jgi:hypothetical protein
MPLCIFFSACSEYEVSEKAEPNGATPSIMVDPDSLSFIEASMEQTETQIFTIHNEGDASLTIQNLQVVGATTYTIASLDLSDALGGGESMDVAVTYTPTETGADDAASVLVFSNDPIDPTVEVELWGTVGMPLLVIEPQTLDLGTVSTEEEATGTLTLKSAGDIPVTISSFEITGTVFSASGAEAWPLTLEPEEETTLEVSFASPSAGLYAETITVDCDDPAADATAQLMATAEAGAAVAVCSVDPPDVQPNGGSATWYGDQSYDTEGYAITGYDWTLLSQPGGSTANMPSGGANRDFEPDLAGEYIAELVVTNELGTESEPCQAILTATPGQDLWIQMYWTHAGDDMDLHLLRPGSGQSDLQSTNDCYYGNCTSGGLDWGVTGDPSDNPALDLDDISGTGPENINITGPETGDFTVYVHDYPGSTFAAGNDVTVVIFIGGSQVWTDTRTISGEDTYTAFAEVEWPSGTVTGL